MSAFFPSRPTLNSAERGKINRAIKLWKESDGTPEEWQQYANWYRRLWPNLTLTPLAVVSNRSTLRQEALRHQWGRQVAPPPVAAAPAAPVVRQETVYDTPRRRKEEGLKHTRELLAMLKLRNPQ